MASATSTASPRCSAHSSATVAPTSSQAGADQAKDLGYFSSWSYAHPRTIELATRVAELAPGDLNRVFFTNSGSESVEAALKLARQYHRLTGKPHKHKLIAREIAYHGTTFGAMTATGIPDYRMPFEPLLPGAARAQHQHVSLPGEP